MSAASLVWTVDVGWPLPADINRRADSVAASPSLMARGAATGLTVLGLAVFHVHNVSAIDAYLDNHFCGIMIVQAEAI